MRRAFVLALAAALAGSSQASADRHGTATFSGRCELAGTVAFDPPLTNQPQATTQLARLSGTCSGRFVDVRGRAHELDGAPVSDVARSVAPEGSCLAGTAAGLGTLTFPDGRIRFRLSETRLAAFPLLTFEGARSGSARAPATPSTTQDPIAALQACAGPGVAAFDIDARLQTTPQMTG
jgi:hypothetical protein